MRNLTINRGELIKAAVSIATVAAGALLMLLASATTMEVGGEMITILAAPEAITSVTGPELSDEALAAEREFFVPVMRAELRLPEPPAIAVGEIREQAKTWLGEGPIAALTEEIRIEAPDVIRDQGFEVRLEVPELKRPELPSPLPVR